jgi:hypothetical protein
VEVSIKHISDSHLPNVPNESMKVKFNSEKADDLSSGLILPDLDSYNDGYRLLRVASFL